MNYTVKTIKEIKLRKVRALKLIKSNKEGRRKTVYTILPEGIAVYDSIMEELT